MTVGSSLCLGFLNVLERVSMVLTFSLYQVELLVCISVSSSLQDSAMFQLPTRWGSFSQGLGSGMGSVAQTYLHEGSSLSGGGGYRTAWWNLWTWRSKTSSLSCLARAPDFLSLHPHLLAPAYWKSAQEVLVTLFFSSFPRKCPNLGLWWLWRGQESCALVLVRLVVVHTQASF